MSNITDLPPVPRPTTIINLWGGPGSGKSTTAAEVFAIMKHAGMSVELITEYVKAWAWRGERIGEFDDIYLFAKQSRRESACYGKVDWLITDSPLGLSAVYERLYHPSNTFMRDVCAAHRTRQHAAGITHVNCLVRRVQAGRYEDETAARRVDGIVEEYLRCNANRPWHIVQDAADVIRAAGVVLP
jgi:hypothetical protein